MPNDKNKTDAVDEQTLVDEQGVSETGAVSGVDDVLSALRAQVEASEQRHGDVLSNMKERLGTLSGDVNEIRDRIPEDLPRKLQGIETGLETLNERVSQISMSGSASPTQAASPAEEFTSESIENGDEEEIKFDALDQDLMDQEETESALVEFAAVDNAPTAPRDVNELVDDDDDTHSVAPAALKSAAPESDFNEQPVESSESHHAHAVDTFDLVDTGVAGDPSSPWDEESAEALTSLYDAPSDAETGFGADDAHTLLARTPDPEMDMDQTPSELATGTDDLPHEVPTTSAIDRDWLDAKFSEIAERIELTLKEFDPDKSSQHITDRIESFENRVGMALDEVATREDLSGLQDMQAHLANTEAQMQRLDSIEGSLHEVMTRFAEGGGFAQLADVEGMPQGGVDADAIAEVAALRIADQLQASGHGADGNAIADMRHMIEEFLNENRQGNEHTALMLDTIQQAMIRILDRLDVLEGATGVATDGGAPELAAPVQDPDTFQHPEHAADEVAMAAQGWADPHASGGHGSDDDIMLSEPVDPATALEDEATVEFHARESDVAEPVDHVGDVAAQSVDSITKSEPLAGSHAPAQEVAAQDLAGSEVSAPQPTSNAPVHPSPDLLSDRTDAVVVPAAAGATSRETIDKIRHNFIADAQQAKARAAQSAAQAAAQAPQKPSRKSVLPGLAASKDGDGKAGFLGNLLGSKTRRLLVGAILAVVAIQGTMMLLPRGETSAPATSEPAAVTQSKGETSQKDAPPKPQKSSHFIPNDGFSPGVSNDVVMNDLRLAAADAAHQANGAVDLPFGLTLHQTTAKAWTQQGRPILEPKPAVVTPIALSSEDTANNGRVYKAPQRLASKERIALPPLTVGPTSLRMAAAKGDASAQFEVATRLSEGKGIKQDFKEAATWFKRSAGQGFAPAQYRLGTLYERGLGVERDAARAQMWYLRAAELGNIRAMHNLAVLAAGQSSGRPDYARASQWFLKAAESGLSDSQFNVGVLYENGLGVAKDLVQAYKWYTLAARTGDKESLKRSQKLRSQLPIEQLGEAETAVRSFKPNPVDPLINNSRIAGQDWKKRQNT